MSRAWWCIPVIPAFMRLRQEDGEFEVGHMKTISKK
jgi:hypothetical protein